LTQIWYRHTLLNDARSLLLNPMERLPDERNQVNRERAIGDRGILRFPTQRRNDLLMKHSVYCYPRALERWGIHPLRYTPLNEVMHLLSYRHGQERSTVRQSVLHTLLDIQHHHRLICCICT
jgi:hypothetical protein